MVHSTYLHNLCGASAALALVVAHTSQKSGGGCFEHSSRQSFLHYWHARERADWYGDLTIPDVAVRFKHDEVHVLASNDSYCHGLDWDRVGSLWRCGGGW